MATGNIPPTAARIVAFPAVSGGSALLLAATDMVRFVPDGKDGGTATFTYVAWDQTTGIHGNKADAQYRAARPPSP